MPLYTSLLSLQGKDVRCITGCIVSPNGKVILLDCYSNSKLVILNDDGTLDKEITCSMGYSFDVTYLDDRTVAMSTWNGIEIINIDTKKTERRINCYIGVRQQVTLFY
jgi:hypothetical protein